MGIDFKSELHEQQTYELLKKFGKKEVTEDSYYGSFAYIVGATYIADSVLGAIDEADRTLDIDKVKEILGVCSGGERRMLRFALQCFNNSIDDITIGEVMSSLDEENKDVIIFAIMMRY